MSKAKRLFPLIILGLVFIIDDADGGVPQHFAPVNPTGVSKPVVIQNVTTAIAPGDEIGVFDGTRCVGAEAFEGAFPITIAAWMEQILPDGSVLPGARSGNLMIFKFWQQSSDTELDATPTYSVGTGTFGEPLTVVSLLLVPVRVELSSFTAVAIGNSVKLAWSTQTETNNYAFCIERSRDGIRFSQIGSINGNETNPRPHDYSFTDTDLSLGTYYYRVKQIDSDGSFCYSDVLKVEVKAPSVCSLSQNYPNPFNCETRIIYQLSESGPVTLKIYNSLGQEIKTLVQKVMMAGYHSVIWDGKDTNGEVVPSGTYYYEVRAADFDETRRLVFVK